MCFICISIHSQQASSVNSNVIASKSRWIELCLAPRRSNVWKESARTIRYLETALLIAPINSKRISSAAPFGETKAIEPVVPWIESTAIV